MDSRIVTVAALALAIAGCSRPAERQPVETAASAAPPAAAPAPPPTAASAPTIVYACANGVTARASYPDAQTAIVDYQGRTHEMKLAAAGGARYVGDGLQWWTHGQAQAAVAPLGVAETMSKGGVVSCTAQGQGPTADAAATVPEPAPPATREVPK